MGLVVAPIVEGKLEAWKSWTSEFKGSRKSEFDDFNQRYGLTRHDIWLVESPNGPLAVVLHEGPGGETFMEKVAQSENSFDKSFAKKVAEFHGMDLNAPPPGPPPTKVL
jgi:hypothetical protein